MFVSAPYRSQVRGEEWWTVLSVCGVVNFTGAVVVSFTIRVNVDGIAMLSVVLAVSCPVNVDTIVVSLVCLFLLDSALCLCLSFCQLSRTVRFVVAAAAAVGVVDVVAFSS